MIELLNFLKVLVRHRMTLIIVPLAAVIVTYFLVKHLPDKYVSQSRIATGIVDNTAPASASRLMLQDMQAAQEFDNVIQMMMLKKIVNQVSYQLIVHDLTTDSSYRKKSKLVNQLNSQAKAHAIEVYNYKYRHMEDLSLFNKDEKGLYEVLKSMRYDYTSILKDLRVYRAGNSDFITVEFESENPTLSAFVVNTLCREFITYYTSVVKENQFKETTYLDSMMRAKQNEMTAKMDALKDYKIKNRVLNLNEQAKALYGQLADFETKKELAERDVESYTAAIKNIDRKFDPADRRYMESSLVSVNKEIDATKKQIKDLNQKYISSNFDPSYQPKLDALKADLANEISEAADKHAYNPLVAKENLVTQKLTLETSRELAENGLDVLNAEITTLNRRLDVLVPNEAVIEAYQKDIDIVSREYIELLAKYNESSMASNSSVRMRQAEVAMPGTQQPSKKMLLVILSGIISFVFCIVVLFILFMLDRSIQEPKALANATGMPVLGHLNLVKGDMLDFGRLWEANVDSTTHLFKELVRSVRFELENDLTTGQKIIGITSLQPSEGKTFLTVSLAYAFNHINQRVLIIDGNFQHPSISETVHSSNTLEAILKNNTPIKSSSMLDVIANKGGDISLLELADHQTIAQTIAVLKNSYDIILIETTSLDTRNVAKEWLLFTDKVISVFEAGNSIHGNMHEDVAYLRSLGHKFAGWVLNKVPEAGVAKKSFFKRNSA